MIGSKCIKSESEFQIEASIAITPIQNNTLVKGLFWIEYYDGLTRHNLMKSGIGEAVVDIFEIGTYQLLDTWNISPNNSGHYLIEKTYPFVINKDYLFRFRINFLDEYPFVVDGTNYIERDLIMHFRKPLGRYVKLFDEELGIIIE